MAWGAGGRSSPLRRCGPPSSCTARGTWPSWAGTRSAACSWRGHPSVGRSSSPPPRSPRWASASTPRAARDWLPALLCLTVLGRRAPTLVGPAGAGALLRHHRGDRTAGGAYGGRPRPLLGCLGAASPGHPEGPARAGRAGAGTGRSRSATSRWRPLTSSPPNGPGWCRARSTLSALRLKDMGDMADAAATSLCADGLAHLHARGVSATQELRGLLGLLRSDAARGPGHRVRLLARAREVPLGAGRGRDRGRGRHARRRGAGAARNPADDRTVWLAVLLTAALALRRTSPTAAVLAAAVPFVAALALGVPLMHGLAECLALALLTWGALACRCTAGGHGLVGHGPRGGGCGHSVRPSSTERSPERSWRPLPSAPCRCARWPATSVLANARIEHLETTLATSVGAGLERERVAIARDLHDVVGHALGVMMIQAGAARALALHDPCGARRALGPRRGGRPGRRGGAGPDGGARRPGRRVRRPGGDGGEDADRRAGRHPRPGRSAADRTARSWSPIRVAQEALTNAVRHAPGSRIRAGGTSRGRTASSCGSTTSPGPRRACRAARSAGPAWPASPNGSARPAAGWRRVIAMTAASR